MDALSATLKHTNNIRKTRTRVMVLFMPMSLLKDRTGLNLIGRSFEDEA